MPRFENDIFGIQMMCYNLQDSNVSVRRTKTRKTKCVTVGRRVGGEEPQTGC
jgi:hypothetical protein